MIQQNLNWPTGKQKQSDFRKSDISLWFRTVAIGITSLPEHTLSEGTVV